MNAKTMTLLAVLAVASTLSSGCVTGRRMITLETPTQATAAPAGKGSIAIASVTDQRRFENKPASPSTPSIDGDVGSVARDALKVMIGRQRNGYGGAMGDVALAGDATVESQMRSLIEEGLKRRGYAVGAGSGGDSIDVRIDEFWAWFSPGFATVSFEAQIKSQIALSAGGKQHDLIVRGYGLNRGQVASDANWQLAYTRAFEDFLKNLDRELEAAGL